MNFEIVFLGLFCVWSSSNAFSITKLQNKPPPAQHGFNLLFVQQDEIGKLGEFTKPTDPSQLCTSSMVFIVSQMQKLMRGRQKAAQIFGSTAVCLKAT